jgi:hydrogenase nickel incorporation protein HypB
MCSTCGCENNDEIIIHFGDNEHEHIHEDENHETDEKHDEKKHSHHHSHDDHHDHKHDKSDHKHHYGHHHNKHLDNQEHNKKQHGYNRRLEVEMDILNNNNLMAERNRGYFEAKKVLTLNLMSSPGSGKTTILERTITDLKNRFPISIIEGDQQTSLDADRIKAVGVPVVQINTGNGCHLDAKMVNAAILKLDIQEKSMLFIENVGNLVCPSLFDLGESIRVVIISVTEGDDKPLKYPTIFDTAQVCIINKTDLIPYVDFNIEKVKENALKVNNRLEFFELSAKTGSGLENWYKWLEKMVDRIPNGF